MRTFRTIIVDEDSSARKRIVEVLQEWSEIEIIGEFNNGEAATKAINTDKPDLVFMEIEMPDLNSLEVIENIDEEHNSLVIFVSSYQDFAVQAFELEVLKNF